MITLQNALIHFFRNWKRIYSLNINKHLQNEIFKSYFHGFVIGRPNPMNKQVRITGFRVSYCDFKSLFILFEEIFVNHVYYFTAVKRNPFIIDCGSNIGLSILFFKLHYPDAKMIAFEPDDAAYSCLQKNVRENNLQNVDLIKKALSSKDGIEKFYYDITAPGGLWASTNQARIPKNEREVEATVLSKYINGEVDFLKIDIEGAEEMVIAELSKEKRLHYIQQMVIEYHHHIHKENDSFSRIIRILEDEGFGYQIDGMQTRPFQAGQYQDLLIYAYRKDRLTCLVRDS